jgi:hypothetical protein
MSIGHPVVVISGGADHPRDMDVNRAFRPYRKRPSREELRKRCETARLDLRALYRSLDRHHLLRDVPREVHALQEIDADLAEALWVLDQRHGQFDLKAMTRDTEDSLERIPAARDRVLALLTEDEREDVLEDMSTIRVSLMPEEAYLEVPGRDPMAG